MAKRKRVKGQTGIYNPSYRKQKIPPKQVVLRNGEQFLLHAFGTCSIIPGTNLMITHE
jgi:hypothetical protein